MIETQVKSWGIKAIGKEIFTVQGEYSANMLREAILKEELDISKLRRHREDHQSYVRDVHTEVCTMY